MRGKRKLRIQPKPRIDPHDVLILALAQPRLPNPDKVVPLRLRKPQGYTCDEIREMSAARIAQLLSECDQETVAKLRAIFKGPER